MTTNDRTVAPASLEEALEIRASAKVRPVAGGTDLMVQHRPTAPVPVVLDAPPLFLSHLAELRGIEEIDGSLVAGAAARLTDISEHPLCPPGLRETLRWFASPAIRNVATVGGNICNASPAADLLPFLAARGATLTIASSHATRRIPIAEFITGPGSTTLAADELLTAIRIPLTAIQIPLPPSDESPGHPVDDFWLYRKVAPRRSNALSKLAVYAEARRSSYGKLAGFALAVGAVAPTVVRAREAEFALIGSRADDIADRLPTVLSIYSRLVRPIDDQRSTADYRERTTMRLVRDIIERQLKDFLEKP